MALRLAPPVETNLLNYLWPLLIVVLSPLFVPGTKLGARHIGGVVLGFAGAALIVTGGRAGFTMASMQGYALARPMAADDIPTLLRGFRPDSAWYRPAGGIGGA